MSVPRVKGTKELVVLNYYQDGCPFDFTLELHKIEASIKRHKARIELSEKHNIETADSEALPDLISDLRYIKGILNGEFDILVICEEDREIHTDSAGVNITDLEEQFQEER